VHAGNRRRGTAAGRWTPPHAHPGDALLRRGGERERRRVEQRAGAGEVTRLDLRAAGRERLLPDCEEVRAVAARAGAEDAALPGEATTEGSRRHRGDPGGVDRAAAGDRPPGDHEAALRRGRHRTAPGAAELERGRVEPHPAVLTGLAWMFAVDGVVSDHARR